MIMTMMIMTTAMRTSMSMYTAPTAGTSIIYLRAGTSMFTTQAAAIGRSTRSGRSTLQPIELPRQAARPASSIYRR